MPQESPTDYSALFDDGGDPYSALFDGDPVEPASPTDEGGAGDQGPPTQFSDKPIDPMLRMPAAARREAAKQEGWEDAIPFLRNLEAAMTMGLTDQTYDQAKAASVARRDALREEFPLEYWGRNVPGSVGVGLLANRAGGPKLMGVGPVDALAMYGQGENQGSATFGGDVVAPMLAGSAIANGVGAGLKIVQAVGKALQVPLAAAEKLIEAYGPRKVFDMLRGADTSEAGKVIAQRVEALKGNIDAAERFVPAEVPKIRPKTDAEWRALELADQAERGKAQIFPDDGVFYGDPSLEGGDYDAALRDAMRKNVPDFDESADLLGEFERVKYPDLKPPPPDVPSSPMPETMRAVAEDVPTAAKRVPVEPPSHLQPADGHGLDPAPVMPPAEPRLPKRDRLYAMLKDAIGLDDHDLSKADAFYEAWKRGQGPKPPPFDGPHLDEVNTIFGLKGRRRLTSAREAFDRILAANEGKSWEDVERTLPLMRTIPGFEDLRLPDEAMEAMLSARQLHPAERSASFNPSRLDAQLADDARAAKVAAERADPSIAHKGEFRGPTGRAKDKPRLVTVPPEGEGSFLDDWGLKPANESDLVSGVHQRRVRLDDSALDEGVREESELSRQYFERMDRSASVPAGVEVEGMTSTQRADMLNAVKRDTAAGMQQRRAALVTKAREYRTLMAQADAIESQNRMEAARLRGIAEQSRTELAAILKQKQQNEEMAKAIAERVRFDIPLTALAASAAGQKLSAWGAANAERWAATGGELGRLARWALSGSGGLRMFLLGQAAQQLGEDQTDSYAGTVTPSP